MKTVVDDGVKRLACLVEDSEISKLLGAESISFCIDYIKRKTSVPRALSCAKIRQIIRCQVFRQNGELLEILGDGMSFCRPPDKFDLEAGAKLAFERMLEELVESVMTKAAKDRIKAVLWEEFFKTKAWRRVNVIK